MYGKSITAALASALVLGIGVTRGDEYIDPVRIWLDEMAPKRYGTRGAGISMAQQKRAAKKARNVRWHKSRVRG